MNALSTMPEPGMYPNVTFAEYSAWPAINQSALKPYLRSPKHGRWEELTSREASPSQRLGDATDVAIFEPERFAAEYTVTPNFTENRNSNAYKAKRRAWDEQNSGKVALTPAQYASCIAMRDALLGNDIARHLLREAKSRTQFSMLWKDRETGLICKARVDGLAAATLPELNGRVWYDLKTSKDPSPEGFGWECGKYGYDIQAAFYLDGIQQLSGLAARPVIIAVENTAPYDVVVHELSAEFLVSGQAKVRRLLALYKWCQEQAQWPGMCEGVNLLGLPKKYQEVE